MWTPPDRVFAPVWTFLYGCMGVSASLVAAQVPFKSATMRLFFFHYACNLLWAPLFFGLKVSGIESERKSTLIL